MQGFGPAGRKGVLRCSLQTCNLKCLFIAASGRVVFAYWQTGGYFNMFSNKSQQENRIKRIHRREDASEN
jgi:hypothetical protein